MMGKGQKLLIWTVVLLLLCNVGLVLTMWVKPGGKSGPAHGGPRDFVIASLKFTDAQVKQYDALIEEHQRSMRRLRREAMELRQRLFNNIKDEGHGGLNADSLANLIGQNQKEIESVTYRHFAQVRAICTDQQKQEFDKIIGDVARRMSGRPGQPPGREEGGPPRERPGGGPEGGEPQGPPPPPPGERENP